MAVVIATAMCVLSFIFQPELPLGGTPGLCLPSPAYWIKDPFLSWIINFLIMGSTAILIYFVNQTYNFVRINQPVLPALFLLLTAANPWITNVLNTSMIMALVNILCLSILFGAYKSTNATQEMFLIATFLSLGSMFEYAFLPMGLAYLLGALIMKALRLKELLAFFMGLVAPYWVGLGFGILKLEWFRMPEITYLFADRELALEIFLLLVSVAVVIFIGICTGMSNSIRLYAGNSRVNAMNLAISVLGSLCVICILIDFNNILAYLATLYFTVAVQLANLCALWQMRHEWIVVGVAAIIFIGFFAAMIAV